MLSDDDKQVLKHTAIRGRIALALTCIQNAVDQNRIDDDRITELTDVLWRFVENDNVDLWEAGHDTQVAADLFEAVETRAPMPDAYRELPTFLPEALYETLWIGIANWYAGVVSYSEESFDHTVNVLDLCEKNGVPIPSLSVFARLPFDAAKYPRDYGWGPPVPRSFFAAS